MRIISHKKVKIRKSRQCFLCGTVKAQGQEMFRQTVADGEISTNYRCLDCEEFINMNCNYCSIEDGIKELCLLNCEHRHYHNKANTLQLHYIYKNYYTNI